MMRALPVLALALAAGCASFDGAAPQTGDPAISHSITGIASRTFDAPMARIKPVVIATLVGMGMRIAALEVKSGREFIRAKRSVDDVEIELEPVSAMSTRLRVAVRDGGGLYDSRTADKILIEILNRLGNT